VLALVLQHPSELTPACIEHGLCHARARELGATHITDVDVLVSVNNAPGEFVAGVRSLSGHFAMQALHLFATPAALEHRNPSLGVAVEVPRVAVTSEISLQ